MAVEVVAAVFHAGSVRGRYTFNCALLIKCEFDDATDVCQFCETHGHKCGPKITKAVYAQLMGGRPCPALRYSSIVTEVEKENPNAEPDEIHTIAGIRLEELKADRERLQNGMSAKGYTDIESHTPPSTAGSDATVAVGSPPPLVVKKRSHRSTARGALKSVKHVPMKKCLDYVAEHAPTPRRVI